VTTYPSPTPRVKSHPFLRDDPLVVVERGGYPASVHRGVLAVADPDGTLTFSVGDPAQRAFLRSAAKPFQVMPAILSGGVDRFGLTPRELAVLCASHNAEERHREAILSILDRIGLPESALACGAHSPLHAPSAEALIRAGKKPTNVCNNCSGAHTGMLLACIAMGWPTDSYGNPDHPLQVMTRSILGAFAGVESDSIEMATDNCSVPTFRLPVLNTARAFARLASGANLERKLASAAARVREAMTAHPEMVAGEGRFDTALMQAAQGTIVAKGGADGFQGVGVIDRGLGLALKISDGGSRAVAPAVVPVLRYMEALSPEDVMQLRQYAEPDDLDCNGTVVGRIRSLLVPDTRA